MVFQLTDEERPVGLIQKASAVFSALCLNPVQSTAQIARAIDEPVSSVYRLLDGLTKLGWIEPAPGRGRYRVGSMWMAYASSYLAGMDLRHVALPLLHDLRDTTGETSFLCVRRGDRAACIERVEGPGVQSLALTIGGSLPLHVGAAPQVLLAFEPEEQREEYLQSLPLEVARLRRADCDLIRRDGYALSDGDVTPGIAAIGVPVLNRNAQVIAAISVSGLREHVMGARSLILPSLISSARTLSANLGYVEERP